ncbi:Xylulose kinase [bioreactor metagenome]|uniref:Xylulose kinase n=1 Tax=bioreactor metagenome TaxID=1076179 RepID=A0A645H528_9ZZZZ
MSEASAPGANGVTFLPYLCGERAPLWNRSLRGIYFGLGTDTTKADMVRAVMEGSAYALRSILDEFNDPSLHQKVVLGTGGGYKSRIWSQIKSDVLNCSILVRQTTFDAALTGNALLVMRALGYPDCRTDDNTAAEPALYVPDPAKREFYEERYHFFREIYQANKDLFATKGV